MRGTPQDRFWAKVDKSGDCWLWTASTRPCNGRLYGQFGIEGRNYYAHRLSYEWCVGPIPPGCRIDHKCHHSLCVNPAHLRTSTQAQNLQNRRSLNRNNTSGYRGVYYASRDKRWVAAVADGDMIWRRYFATKDEAAAAAEAMRDRHFTHHR